MSDRVYRSLMIQKKDYSSYRNYLVKSGHFFHILCDFGEKVLL